MFEKVLSETSFGEISQRIFRLDVAFKLFYAGVVGSVEGYSSICRITIDKNGVDVVINLQSGDFCVR